MGIWTAFYRIRKSTYKQEGSERKGWVKVCPPGYIGSMGRWTTLTLTPVENDAIVAFYHLVLGSRRVLTARMGMYEEVISLNVVRIDIPVCGASVNIQIDSKT